MGNFYCFRHSKKAIKSITNKYISRMDKIITVENHYRAWSLRSLNPSCRVFGLPRNFIPAFKKLFMGFFYFIIRLFNHKKSISLLLLNILMLQKEICYFIELLWLYFFYFYSYTIRFSTERKNKNVRNPSTRYDCE